MKSTTSLKAPIREAPLTRVKKSATRVSTDSIKAKDVEIAFGHFRTSIGHGEKYLKFQKTKLTEKNYKLLEDGVSREINSYLQKTGKLSSLGAVFEKFSADMRAIAKTITASLKFPVFDLNLNLTGIDLEGLERTLAEVAASEALLDYLEKAVADPAVKKSTSVLSIAEFLLKAVKDSSMGFGADSLLKCLNDPAIKLAIKTQAQSAAKKPRGNGKALTIQIVADRFNENSATKRDAVISKLAAEFKVASRTVERRLKEATEKKLLT
jgi:DNA-binding Lrp family transcriptional regulator